MGDKVRVDREELAALVDTLTSLRAENEELKKESTAAKWEEAARLGHLQGCQ